MKKKFLDKYGNPKPGVDKETVKFIQDLELDLKKEAEQRDVDIQTGIPKNTPLKAKPADTAQVDKRIISAREILSEMIITEPALTAKLCEAIDCGRFFVTVTFLKNYKPAVKNDLHHFFCVKGIEPNDCIGSIKHIKNDFIAKKMPNAALDKDAGWH
jgi:hypothetical protein